LRRWVVVLIAGSALLTACSSGQQQSRDDLQVAATLVAATPAPSPPAGHPAGSVVPLAGGVTAMVVDPASRTLAVAVPQPAAVLLYPLDDLGQPPRSVPLPGPASQLALAAPGGPLLAPVESAGQLLRIAVPAGTAQPVHVDGAPVTATQAGANTLVGLRGRGVAVLDGDRTVRTITGSAGADVLLPVGDRAVLLDRLRTAVFDLDPAAEGMGAGMRAGDGATNAVTDRYGRVLVTDTRGGELMAFSANPLLMRQRYPVPGGIYGIAYDSTRDLAWVTLTERNEVVGFDVAGGEPVERHRFPTVHQPNAVAVDPGTGRVFVASADGEGIQVIAP
jgi:DNA-binding beta-propeller fold protein YncE